LDITGLINKREKKDQILDSMDLERERGITIKMQPVTMEYQGFTLNLIDTPGHVDFSYEVSRALAAVEGAILLVDATQGIQAQTLANLYLALEQDLTIIPVVNKIDLPAAQVFKTKKSLSSLLGIKSKEVLAVSAKTGQGIDTVLQAVIDQVPAPKILKRQPFKALIFDSFYDKHKGVICDVRVFSGSIKSSELIYFYQTKTQAEVKEIGIYTLKSKKQSKLLAGGIGYITTGIRDVGKCQVGDTIFKLSNTKKGDITPLPGYKKAKPVVFSSVYPKDQSRYLELRKALEQLRLNDASLDFSPINTKALGRGFNLGVLGLLHLDIITERIRREYQIDLILTVPQVEYRLKIQDQEYQVIASALDFPKNKNKIKEIQEPWVKLELIMPEQYIGDVMQFVIAKRGEYKNTEYLEDYVVLHFDLPLSELLTDFYDKLKSVSSGYASLNYQITNWRPVDLVKVSFLVAQEEKSALTFLSPRSFAETRARVILKKLKEQIKPELFEIRLQAKIDGRIVASERIKALRKNVTAKLYGGDVTRKKKLLKKQRKGKRRMQNQGSVEIPTSAYLSVLQR